MKIERCFFSLLTTPAKGDVRSNFGKWVTWKHKFYSWILAVGNASEFYPTYLVTDDLGKKWLCDVLQLPFTGVFLDLNDWQHLPPHLWAMGKLVAYKRMNERINGRFSRAVHIDDDFILKRPFDRRFEESELLVQSKEEFISHYGGAYQEIYKDANENLAYFPEAWLRDKERPFFEKTAWCTSVVSSTNEQLLEDYTTQMLEFAVGEENAEGWQKFDTFWANCLIEQYGIGCFSKYFNVKPTVLLEEHEFNNKNVGFAHIWGGANEEATCNILEQKVREKYPEIYERVENIF